MAGKLQPAPLRLTNDHYLLVWQRLGLRRKERYLTTLEYHYVYQATASDDSWIVRYEYEREPQESYPYPVCHVHVNATPETYSGAKPFPDLHLPAGERVTIESLVRHLVREHKVPSISDDWSHVVDETEKAFAEIQRKRFAT